MNNILDRLYSRHGNLKNLDGLKKAEIQAEFAESFITEEPSKGLLGRLFRRTIKTSERLTEEELAKKLVDDKLAESIEEAKKLVPDVVSRNYKGRYPVFDYEFTRSVDDGTVRWQLIVGCYHHCL